MVDKVYIKDNGRPAPTKNRYVVDSAYNFNVPSEKSTLNAAILEYKDLKIAADSEIVLATGSYSGPHNIQDIETTNTKELIISGDTHAQAGVVYVDGFNVTESGGVYGGNGVVTITKTDVDQYTITRSGGNPSFSGVSPGRLFYYTAGNNTFTYTLSSVSGAGNNVLTFSSPVNDVLYDGSALVLVPDVLLSNSVVIDNVNATIRFKKIRMVASVYISSSGSATDEPRQGPRVIFENCVSAGGVHVMKGSFDTESLKSTWFSSRITVYSHGRTDLRKGCVLAIGGNPALLSAELGAFAKIRDVVALDEIEAQQGGKIFFQNGSVFARGGFGPRAFYGGKIYLKDSSVSRHSTEGAHVNYKGLDCEHGSKITARNCTFDYMGTTLYANNAARIITIGCTFTNYIVLSNPTANTGLFANNDSLITTI